MAATTQTQSVAAVRTEAPRSLDFGRAHPFVRLGANTLDAFTGEHLVLHAAALVTTPLIIETGADTAIHNVMASQQRLEPPSIVGVYLGYGLPLLLGGGLMTTAFVSDSQRELVASGAVLQSTALALAYQSLLKAFTGRPAPPAGHLESDEASHRFRFGFLRGGIHYGWPSGHMMTTTAIYASLLQVYPDSLWCTVGGGAVLAFVFGSVAIHERASMHWSSDMVAGTLMGFALGRGVGRGFAQRFRNERAAARFTISPWLSTDNARGLSLSGRF